LKKLDRDVAKQALARARQRPRVDLAIRSKVQRTAAAIKNRARCCRRRCAGLGRASSFQPRNLLAAAVLDLFPGTKLGIGPALLEDPRYGFFYDVYCAQSVNRSRSSGNSRKKIARHCQAQHAYRRDEISKTEAMRSLPNVTSL